MKRYLFLLVFVVLLQACADNNSGIILTVKSSGEMHVVPDMASISISLGCTNKDIKKASGCAGKIVDEIFTLLDENQVSKKDYHSTRINLEKEYSWKRNSRIFVGYRSSSTISVLFRDLDVMNRVISQMLVMDRAEIYGLQYSHSQYDELSNQAYLRALDNAEKMAKQIMLNQKASSIKVLTVSNTDSQRNEAMAVKYADGLSKARVASEVAQSPSASLNPGELVLLKDIYVVYRLGY